MLFDPGCNGCGCPSVVTNVVEVRGCNAAPVAGVLVESFSDAARTVVVDSQVTASDGRVTIIPATYWRFTPSSYFAVRTAAPPNPVGGVRIVVLAVASPYDCCPAYAPRSRPGVRTGWTLTDPGGTIEVDDGCNGGVWVDRTVSQGAIDRTCVISGFDNTVNPLIISITTAVRYTWNLRRINEGGPIATQSLYQWDTRFDPYLLPEDGGACADAVYNGAPYWRAFRVGRNSAGVYNGSGSPWPSATLVTRGSDSYAIVSYDPLVVSFSFTSGGPWLRTDGLRPSGAPYATTLVLSEST